MYGEKPTERADKQVVGIKLTQLLKTHPGLEIQAINLQNGKIYRLILNSRNQLSFVDGKSIRLLSPQDEQGFELTEDSAHQIESQESKGLTEDRPGEVAITRLDTATLVRGINNFIDSVGKPEHCGFEMPEGQYNELFTPIATIDFQLVLPPVLPEAKTLSRRYLKLIRQKLLELEKKLKKKGMQAERILTKGMIRKIPGILVQLERRLRSAGIRYAIIDGRGPYYKLEAWLENDIKFER
jgi:hypothetical protein